MTDQIENVIAEDVSLKQVADALEAKTVATDALIDSKVSTEALDQVKADSEAQIKSLNDKTGSL